MRAVPMKTDARVYALMDRTLLHVEQGERTVLSASLPAPSEEAHLGALSEILEGLGIWLEAHLDVVVYVSATDPSWWAYLDAPNGLPLGGTCYDCTIVVEDDTSLAGFGDEMQS
jgi:hypothetical protein